MRISVIIPTFNRACVITRAIDSVLQQTRPPDEIIVIDDGSTDATRHTLGKIDTSKVTVFHQQHNQGVSAARNFGISHCTGDWVALIDSDDEWLPEKLNLQVHNLQCSAHTICHTDEIWIRNGERVNQMKKHKKHGGDIFEHCLAMCAMSPSSVLLKKNLITDAGGFDESLPACEDYDLWLKLCVNNPVLFINQPLLRKYGGHADQLSRKHWGMDRFRVYSLEKLLESAELSDSQRQLTVAMLLKKTRILHKGAIKHNNQQLAEHCDLLQQKYA